MIPPSVPLVIGAILTRNRSANCSLAAVVPGIIASMIAAHMIGAHHGQPLNPPPGPAGPACAVAGSYARAVAGAAGDRRVHRGIVGIYGGWANQPTEAAAIGAAACGILAIVTGGMRMKGVIDSALGTANTPR